MVVCKLNLRKRKQVAAISILDVQAPPGVFAHATTLRGSCAVPRLNQAALGRRSSLGHTTMIAKSFFLAETFSRYSALIFSS